MTILDENIQYVRGVGEKKAKLLEKGYDVQNIDIETLVGTVRKLGAII